MSSPWASGDGGTAASNAAFKQPSLFTLTGPLASPSICIANVNWKFACSHIFNQQKAIPWLFQRPSQIQNKSSNQQCPECLEANEDKHQAEREAARKKDEEEAVANEGRDQTARVKLEKEAMLLGSQTRQEQEEEGQEAMQAKSKEQEQEAKSLSLYKRQAAFVAQQIQDAGDDEQTRADFTKFLKSCKLLWANKVRKSASVELVAGSGGCKTRKDLEERLEKAELMVARAEILREQHDAKHRFRFDDPKPGDAAAKVRKIEILAQREAWIAVVAKMKKAMELMRRRLPHT